MLQVLATMELVSCLCCQRGHHPCMDHSTIWLWNLLQHRPNDPERQLCDLTQFFVLTTV